MSIVNIEALTYGVDDLDVSRRFWREFGLTATDNPDSFSAQDGATVNLRPIDDPQLPKAIEPGNTMREVTYGVNSAAALPRIATALRQHGTLSEESEKLVRGLDPFGFALAFRKSTKRSVLAPELRFNIPGRPDRIDTRGQFHKNAKPLELTHIVYMVDDPEQVVPFYVDQLGFIVSDCYPGRGYFMRGGASQHHHNLFILKIPGKNNFHHAAFELGSIHELFGGGLNMTKRGWKTALGPGRHPVSSCYFWYFKCPSGGAAEYDFDSDIVTENWQAKQLEQTPENFAEWCLAEGMEESLLYRGIQGSRTAES